MDKDGVRVKFNHLFPGQLKALHPY